MNIDFVYIIIVLIVVFGSMVLHELMHGLTAYWLGDDTAKVNGRLTLNPIKHIDPFLTILLPVMLAIFGMPIFGGAKPVPFRPDHVRGGEWGAALVGVSGPLTNLVLAFVFFAVAYITGHIGIYNNGVYLAGGGILADFLSAGIMVNLGFFAFNMLPIPPLDGSRVLYAVAPAPVQKALAAMENFGIIIVFAIILIANNLIGGILNFIIDAVLKFFIMIMPM